jgi:hypothetical protein
MIPKRLAGILFIAAGIVTAVLATCSAYIAGQSYNRLMCSASFIAQCVSVNNTIMVGMSCLGISLVMLATGVIFLIKSWNESRAKE